MLRAEVQSTEVHHGDSIDLVVKVFPRDLCHYVSPSQAWKFARYIVYLAATSICPGCGREIS